MPRLSRMSDKAKTGHGCTKVIGVRATQFTVFANNKPVARRGDPTKSHVIFVTPPPRCVGHKAKINRGSRTVFVRNVPVARVGDSTDMGAMIQGSRTVHAG